jgi:hypothetical protein
MSVDRLGPWLRRNDPETLAAARESYGELLRHLVDAWTDGRYAVMLARPPHLPGDHLMITMSVREITCTWSTLQAIKNDLVPNGHRRWAVEMYPPHRDVVDQAPMRHLYVLPDGHGPDDLFDLNDYLRQGAPVLAGRQGPAR